jgi:hypothetical protein
LIKWQQCGTFHSSGRWYNGPNFWNAPLQRTKEDVYILSLDAELLHGLDLSFVTHMFLLEPIICSITGTGDCQGSPFGCNGSCVHQNYPSILQMFWWLSKVDIWRSRAEKSLNKIVCHHCYRQFDSQESAVRQEQIRMSPACNMEISAVLDNKWMMGSLYRKFWPPLPAVGSSVQKGNITES